MMSKKQAALSGEKWHWEVINLRFSIFLLKINWKNVHYFQRNGNASFAIDLKVFLFIQFVNSAFQKVACFLSFQGIFFKNKSF